MAFCRKKASTCMLKLVCQLLHSWVSVLNEFKCILRLKYSLLSFILTTKNEFSLRKWKSDSLVQCDVIHWKLHIFIWKYHHRTCQICFLMLGIELKINIFVIHFCFNIFSWTSLEHAYARRRFLMTLIFFIISKFFRVSTPVDKKAYQLSSWRKGAECGRQWLSRFTMLHIICREEKKYSLNFDTNFVCLGEYSQLKRWLRGHELNFKKTSKFLA